MSSIMYEYKSLIVSMILNFQSVISKYEDNSLTLSHYI